MKKIIIGIVAGFIVLVIAALVIAGLSLDGIVKRGVETYGPRMTKVEVKLDSVALSVFSGGGEIKGLVLGNPEGFKTPHAISVGRSRLVVKPASLLSDKIVVQVINLEATEITFETGLQGTNLKKILDNLNETTGGGRTNAAPKPTANEPAKKFQVDDFLITGAKVNASITGVGSRTLALPEIHLTHLGTGPDGITTGELTKVVLQEIEKVAARVVAENAGDVVTGAKNFVRGISDKTNNASVENLGKGFNELLKKK